MPTGNANGDHKIEQTEGETSFGDDMQSNRTMKLSLPLTRRGADMTHNSVASPHCGDSIAAEEALLNKYEAALQRIRELEEENEALKRKQVEINTAKELYLKIFEDFPALIWRSRLDKQCDYFNRTWLEWTGKTLEQEFGNGWAEGVHKEDFDRCLETYVKAFDNREAFYMEYRLLDKNGEYRWIGDHGRPFYDLDDTFLGYIGSCYDITDNKNNEQKLVQLNATKDKFFSIVAHDLRNPISTFVTLSEFLMENANEFDEDEMQEVAIQMHKDSKNTLLLLENLLEWSRSQSNESMKFEPKELNVITDLFNPVVQQVDLCAKAKEIAIKCDQGRTTQGTDLSAWDTFGDKNMLKTVLRNLAMNSIKFTKNGGTIQLKAELIEGGSSVCCTPDEEHKSNKKHLSEFEPGTIVITVSDNGVGIPPDHLDGLFELLKDGKKQSTRGTDNEGGSGLGLVICKDFVERHKGTIWAESTVGKGTDFKIALPPVEK